MRLIDADVVTTDSVFFGRIGDFENSSAPRPRQGLADNGRFTLATNIEACLCDPQSPRQRGSKVTFEEGPVLAQSGR
jgi:hypothetical protein